MNRLIPSKSQVMPIDAAARSLLVWAAVLICLLATDLLFGEELQGDIVRVDGWQVRISVGSTSSVQIGDKVTISAEISGVGRIPIDAEWQVSSVEKSEPLSALRSLEGKGRAVKTAVH